jgi:hypothetical protein
VADYQDCARATESDTTAFVELTRKIGHPRRPVVFLLSYHISKTPNPHGPLANDTSRSFQRAKLLRPIPLKEPFSLDAQENVLGCTFLCAFLD